jgi:uncharacterized YccA/Bax inhibitor family protein
MPSSNPVLNQSTFATPTTGADIRPMTLEGVVHRTLFFLLLAVGSATATWVFLQTHETAIVPCLMIGTVGGLVAAVAAAFLKRSVPITGTIYVLFEGLVLGSITLYFERSFPGIALQAVCLTFGIAFALLADFPVNRDLRDWRHLPVLRHRPALPDAVSLFDSPDLQLRAGRHNL